MEAIAILFCSSSNSLSLSLYLHFPDREREREKKQNTYWYTYVGENPSNVLIENIAHLLSCPLLSSPLRLPRAGRQQLPQLGGILIAVVLSGKEDVFLEDATRALALLLVTRSY